MCIGAASYMAVSLVLGPVVDKVVRIGLILAAEESFTINGDCFTGP